MFMLFWKEFYCMDNNDADIMISIADVDGDDNSKITIMMRL